MATVKKGGASLSEPGSKLYFQTLVKGPVPSLYHAVTIIVAEDRI